MGDISFDKVWKVYPDGTQAVRAVDLAIDDGDLMVLVGPSGCGKTTLLRMVAGLEEVTAGTTWRLTSAMYSSSSNIQVAIAAP